MIGFVIETNMLFILWLNSPFEIATQLKLLCILSYAYLHLVQINAWVYSGNFCLGKRLRSFIPLFYKAGLYHPFYLFLRKDNKMPEELSSEKRDSLIGWV